MNTTTSTTALGAVDLAAAITTSAVSMRGDDIHADLKGQLQHMRDAFNAEGVVTLETRLDRLGRCIDLLLDNQQALCEAVATDFGCRASVVTQMADLMTTLHSLKFARKHLRKWMQAEKRSAPFPMNLLGARAAVHYQPKGVIGIMSPWNVPINVLFSPLIDALGAGNRALLKPSEFTPATSQLLTELFPRYFDPTEISVVTGAAEVGAAFSALPLDHLIFTGSSQVGHHIMQAAAANLTPVTLELGGKSPLIVSTSADLADTVEKIIGAKIINSGQLCISPDYCFVPEASMEEFIAVSKTVFAGFFNGCVDNDDYVSIINQKNFDRLTTYVDEAEEQGVEMVNLDPLQQPWRQNTLRKIPLHLAVDPADDLQIMQQEIFGPLLCIKPYNDLQDCISEINRRPRPLALYYFGDDKAEQQLLIETTVAGGMSINDIGVHYACDDLPFGGIGNSGMGQLHGRDGFRTCSHAKAVLKQGRGNIPKLFGTLPPFGKKIEKTLQRVLKK
jgi:coniferyl-aldehyde dehydrogenase